MARPAKLVVWAASLALMAAAGVSAVPASAQTPGTVTVALPSDTPALDPTIDTSPIGVNIRLNIFDQLTDIASDGTVQPRLAVSWEASPDALVWTFALRENVKFHDGKLLTIEDVLWTYNKIINDSEIARPDLSFEN